LNTPIDPREGDRRQKALRARLAALMSQSNKARVGKLGQRFGQVRSVGAIGGARGARIAGNGMARPGALNFLQGPGFGLTRPGPVGGPSMHAASAAFAAPRHVSNPLPTMPLPGDPPAGGPIGANPGMAVGVPGAEGPVPGSWVEDTLADGSYTDTVSFQPANGLVPLGGGRYLDPATGTIHGGELASPSRPGLTGFGHVGV
jgi:hypothetical protein